MANVLRLPRPLRTICSFRSGPCSQSERHYAFNYLTEARQKRLIHEPSKITASHHRERVAQTPNARRAVKAVS